MVLLDRRITFSAFLIFSLFIVEYLLPCSPWRNYMSTDVNTTALRRLQAGGCALKEAAAFWKDPTPTTHPSVPLRRIIGRGVEGI